MINMNNLVYLTLLLLLFLQNYGSVYGKSCNAKSSGCGCDFDDGSGSIDFSPMIGGKSPTFSGIPGKNQQTPATYSFDFCKKFHCDATSTHACQNTGFSRTSIGKEISYEYNEQFKEVTVKMVQINTESETVSKIILHCDEGKTGNGDMSSVEKTGYGPTTTYSATLVSRYGCQTPHGRKSNHELSSGSILCIVFAVCLILYFIGGILFNKFVRKSEELLPHKSFWSVLPSYIKDGCSFSYHRVRRKEDEYQQI